MASNMLNALRILGKIPKTSSDEQAIARAVRQWYEGRRSDTYRNMAERVRVAIESVWCGKCPEDPAGATTNFVVDVVSAIDKSNASEYLKDQLGRRLVMDRMTERIQPSSLSKRIRRERADRTKTQQADFAYFDKQLGILAVDIQVTANPSISLYSGRVLVHEASTPRPYSGICLPFGSSCQLIPG